MPPRGRGRGRGRSGSGPYSDSNPAAALRRIMGQRRQPSVEGSKSKAREGASQSVPRAVSSSSSQPKEEVGSDSDCSYHSCISSFRTDSGDNTTEGSKSKATEGASESVQRTVSSSSSQPTELGSDSDSDSSYDSQIGGFEARSNFFLCGAYVPSENNLPSPLSDSQCGGYDLYERAELIASTDESLPSDMLMLLLFETPCGFVLCHFPGAFCHLTDSVDSIWAEFGDPLRASQIIYPMEILSLEDKSSAITDAGVDKQLVDMINRCHDPGMMLCVGKPEYKRIIESVLKIPCMCSQAVMEVMWGVQQQRRTLMPFEKTKLTKEDRLPMSQGLMKYLRNCGYDIKPDMVNKKIFLTACALFRCDLDEKKNSRILLDARLSIRRISGIACEDWDILKLALAVKVLCRPEKELTDSHGVLAEDVVSKLKRDARKYKEPFKYCWFWASDEVLSKHHLRITKKKLLESLVQKAKKEYEAKEAKVEKAKLDGESESPHNPNHLYPTNLVGQVLRRSSRLNPNMHEDIGRYDAWLDGTPVKRPKYSYTCETPMSAYNAGQPTI